MVHQSRWSSGRGGRVLKKKGKGGGGHNGSVNCCCSRVRHPFTGFLAALAACTPATARSHLREWDTIVTPLCATTMERGLSDHPDSQFVELLCTGIWDGFCVGFNYREHQCWKALGDMRSVREHRDVVEEYIYKERGYWGHFNQVPFPKFMSTPLRLFPKVSRKSGI